MRRRFLAAGVAFIFAAVPLVADAKKNTYVGVDKCGRCHKKDLYGNQVGTWRNGPHSKTLETLGSEKAAEYAKERGIVGSPQQADECLKCHITAHGVDSQLIKYDLDPADGVQCESCHGPGSNYRKRSIMSDEDKSIAKGLVTQSEEVCTACHNDESPGWDPKVGFDYAEAKEKIAHPTPADVRGRISEIEKENEKNKEEE